jgi:hypothetical protein
LRRLSRFSYYLISIDAQNAVIADWAVIPNGISFLPKSSFVLSFSAEDLHTVYDGYMIISTAKSQATLPSTNRSGSSPSKHRGRPLQALPEAGRRTGKQVKKQNSTTTKGGVENKSRYRCSC